MKLAAASGMRRIYAVSNDGRNIYAATVRERNLDRLIDRYSQYDAEVYGALIRKIRSGGITIPEAERWNHHIINALASIDGVVSYRAIGSIPAWVKEIIRELRPA
jgi:hypothetical protein